VSVAAESLVLHFVSYGIVMSRYQATMFGIVKVSQMFDDTVEGHENEGPVNMSIK
jgi:hypothetical protein